MDENIYNRQLGLIHPDKLKMPILIVGAGSIGSWTALALSKLGCSNITIMDGDIIEEHNAGSQVYKASDSGEQKVSALIDKLNILTDQRVKAVPEHFDFDNKEHLDMIKQFPIVIAAVDNITVREKLYRLLKDTPVFYIDARMAGNALEIYTMNGKDANDHKLYEQTLFAEEDTLPVPCSERSVVYNVFIVGGLITDIVARYANAEVPPKEMVMDLYNFTLFK